MSSSTSGKPCVCLYLLHVCMFIHESFAFFIHGRHDSVLCQCTETPKPTHSLVSYCLCKHPCFSTGTRRLHNFQQDSIGTTPQESKKRSTPEESQNRSTVDTTSRAQEAWNYNASTFMKLGSCHSVLINTIPFGHQWNLLTL